MALSSSSDIDSAAALNRVLQLMAIPGKSCEELQVVEFIRNQLRQAGVPETSVLVDDVTKRTPTGGNVGNLIVTLAGTKRGPRRLLMAHLDTVPLCVGSRPVKTGGVIRSADPNTALGGDDRSGASVILTAALEILKRKIPHPPLTFFWPVQEEIGLLGARYVSTSKLGSPKLCFNWDGGSASTVTIGATGGFNVDIEIAGIASHAGVNPEAGISAIAVASLAIADLQQNGFHGLIVKGKKEGTSNIGIVHGGDATNVVMSKVTLQAEVRSHDSQFREKLVTEFRKAFERAVAAIKNDSGETAKLKFVADLKYESFALKESETCVQTALDAVRDVGLEPKTRISNGGLDANWLSARGLPTVTLGSGQADVHTVNETLNIEDYLNGCRIALRLATG